MSDPSVSPGDFVGTAVSKGQTVIEFDLAAPVPSVDDVVTELDHVVGYLRDRKLLSSFSSEAAEEMRKGAGTKKKLIAQCQAYLDLLTWTMTPEEKERFWEVRSTAEIAILSA